MKPGRPRTKCASAWTFAFEATIASRRWRRTSRRRAIAPDATPLPRVSERDAVVSTPSPRPLDGAEILTGRYAQVRRYHTVFWQRHKELADWERVIDKIEKGEKRLQRSKEIREALAGKIARFATV